mgnify:CR=1 FL=1
MPMQSGNHEHGLHSTRILNTVASTPDSTTASASRVLYIITLWLFNIAMENGPFIDDFPIKTSIYKGFSMAMLNNQMVNQLEQMELDGLLESWIAWIVLVLETRH